MGNMDTPYLPWLLVPGAPHRTLNSEKHYLRTTDLGHLSNPQLSFLIISPTYLSRFFLNSGLNIQRPIEHLPRCLHSCSNTRFQMQLITLKPHFIQATPLLLSVNGTAAHLFVQAWNLDCFLTVSLLLIKKRFWKLECKLHEGTQNSCLVWLYLTRVSLIQWLNVWVRL